MDIANQEAVHFDTPDIAARVERMAPAQIDALPFGAIKLDQAATVQFYNETERRETGAGDLPRVGRNWFTEIAPCTNTDRFRGRTEQARLSGTLDIEFSHIGDFDDRTRELVMRIQSVPGGGCWIFVRRAT